MSLIRGEGSGEGDGQDVLVSEYFVEALLKLFVEVCWHSDDVSVIDPKLSWNTLNLFE